MPLVAVLTALLVQPAEPAVAAADSVRVPACAALAARVAPASLVPDLAATLGVHGGAVRWSVGGRRLVVWIQGRPRDLPSTLHTASEWRAAIGDGVLAWSGAAPGLRITIGRDSASADVRVVWARALPTAAPGDPAAGRLSTITAGRTTLERDGAGQAVAATVVLAAASPGGVPYRPSDVRAMALHETGHALGLGHHASPSSIMAPLVTSDRIGAADGAVLRALYSIEVGTACRAGA